MRLYERAVQKHMKFYAKKKENKIKELIPNIKTKTEKIRNYRASMILLYDCN